LTTVSRVDGHLFNVERGIEHLETNEPDNLPLDKRNQQSPCPLSLCEPRDLGFWTIGDQRHAQLIKDVPGSHLQGGKSQYFVAGS